MPDKITLDREAFKVLAADTRVDILRRLEQHKETLTDISGGMGLSPSTVKEHLDRLSQAGLIEQEPGETKWKYYRLTGKGESIVRPRENNVLIVLASSAFVLLAGSVYRLVSGLSLIGRSGGEMLALAERKAFEYDAAGAAAPHASIIDATMPYFNVFLVVFFAFVFGVFAGRLIRR